jgi:hypothetical protein
MARSFELALAQPRHHSRNPLRLSPRLLQSFIYEPILPRAWASCGTPPKLPARSEVEGKGPLDPEGERPGQTGALPRTGATHANARPMAEQDRPIWELDFSLQDLNVSALGQKQTSDPIIEASAFAQNGHLPELGAMALTRLGEIEHLFGGRQSS